MSKATDDLADALFKPYEHQAGSEWASVSQDELRALARAAAAVGAREALEWSAEQCRDGYGPVAAYDAIMKRLATTDEEDR